MMEQQQKPGNAGEKENEQDMGLPEREASQSGADPVSRGSLPSDGPVSQNEGSAGADLTDNLEKDDPKEIRKDAESGG